MDTISVAAMDESAPAYSYQLYRSHLSIEECLRTSKHI
jgi:hypothetical protein